MIAECVICRQEKETVLGTVHVFHEHGQPTPVLKIEVCEDCLNEVGADDSEEYY